MENKKNTKAVISLVLALVSVAVMFLYPDPNTVNYAFILMIVLGVGAIVLSIMAKKEITANPQNGKGMATAGLVIGIIMVIFSGFGFLGLKLMNDPEALKQLCPMTQNCKLNEDGKYSCSYYGTEIICDEDVIPDKYKPQEQEVE